MTPTFLLIFCPGAEDVGRLVKQAADRTGLVPVWGAPHAALLTGGPIAAIALGHDRGVIVGNVFQRHGPARGIAQLDVASADAICDSGGVHLLAKYWGGYCAFLSAGTGLDVIRDPSAALGCYWVHQQGYFAFASHCGVLFDALGATPELDWGEIARSLWAAGLPVKETALEGVEEVLPGTALSIEESGRQQRMIWNPWDHVTPQRRGDMDHPASLRRVVEMTISAWSSPFERVLLGVSGGLDSSIVASCLARGTRMLTCLTMATTDPDGDERPFARLLCDHIGADLEEAFYDIDDVDFDKSTAEHLPRPIGRTVALAYDAAFLRAAARRGIDVFFTGNGGDNVFGFSQSARPLFDRLLAEGLSAGLFSTLFDICKLTGCSPWQAIGAAARFAPVARRSYPWRPDPRFLARDVVADFGQPHLTHPWLDAPKSALPGKAAHIASLLRIQQHLGVSGRSTFAPIVDPLMSQPVVETCLSMPSWEWCAGGVNRFARTKGL